MAKATWEFTHEDLMDAVLTIQKHTQVMPQIGFDEEGELQLVLHVTSEFARSDLWVELSTTQYPMHLVPGDPYYTLYIGGRRHEPEPEPEPAMILLATLATWPSDEFCDRSDQIHDERGES